MTKLEETSLYSIALSVLVTNLFEIFEAVKHISFSAEEGGVLSIIGKIPLVKENICLGSKAGI